MNPSQLAKLWTIFGVALVYYILNSWLVSQGAEGIFGVKLIHGGKSAVALFAIVVGSVLLGMTSTLGIIFVQRLPLDREGRQPAWHARIPVIGFRSFERDTGEVKLYQSMVLFIFSVLPSLSFVHFWGILSNSKLVAMGTSPRLIGSIWDWKEFRLGSDYARLCWELDASTTVVECQSGVTFLPGLEPLLLAAMTIAAVGSAVLYWIKIFYFNRT